MKRSALISDCGQYRYALDRNGILERDDAPNNHVCFIGVNPSTADGEKDDATIRKLIGFCKRWEVNNFTIVNLFALRATDVKELQRHQLPTNLANEGHVWRVFNLTETIIPCWGSLNKLNSRADLLNSVLRIKWLIGKAGKPIKIFGETKDGDPKHPLMLPYSTKLKQVRHLK